MSRDYVAIANQYARDIVGGVIPACKWVQLACARQLRDLEREWRYRFDDDRAAHVCRFIELLPHIKGEWAKQRRAILLEPWQIFMLTTVFGWVDEQGNRRYKKVYEEIPRKNAKSTKASGIGLYLLTADGESGAEVYSAATTRDQAKIVWGDARSMAERTTPFRQRFGVEVSAHAIYVPHTSSTFKPLSRDQGGNLDGLNLHGGIVDEFHGHKERALWDVLVTAMGARSQPLIWAVTTAGFDRAGICYEERGYICKVLDGVIDDEEYFGIIYTIDTDDDWTDPISWQKANPNWNVSVKPEAIEREARKAMQVASATNNFLTKHLNVWVNADTAWMDMRAWDACEDRTLRLEDFEGRECFVALDLASKVDIASKLRLFERDGIYYLFAQHYLPERAVEQSRNSQYGGWRRDGWLTVTDGEVTDYDVIEDGIRDDCTRFDVVEVPFDPFQATQLSGHLLAESVPMVEMRPTVLNFSEPMKQLEALVLSGKIRHNGDPVLTWMVSNVVCHRDAKDNIYPRKEREENKIDGVVATVMAIGRAMLTKTIVSEIFIEL
ncbi:MAG: phage terminase-like protein large subunit [Verrucomicrobiaceae bacterium]|nr:phage terminase-like protein large subunit [Verrucomicrobiaceae bacterium]